MTGEPAIADEERRYGDGRRDGRDRDCGAGVNAFYPAGGSIRSIADRQTAYAASIDSLWQWRIWSQLSKLVSAAIAISNSARGGSGRLESSGAYMSFILSMLARRTRTTRVLSSAI